MTFADARRGLLVHLQTEGWDVQEKGSFGPLRIPYATSPDGRTRMWFKTQAIYVTFIVHVLAKGRSMWIDIRETSFEAIVAEATTAHLHDHRSRKRKAKPSSRHYHTTWLQKRPEGAEEASVVASSIGSMVADSRTRARSRLKARS